MPQFALIVHETPDDFVQRNDARAPAYWSAWTAFSKALEAAGVARGGKCLQAPETATLMRLRADRRLVEDGPYAETKEQLGGFFIVECADIDEAARWAALAPAAKTGAMEVRPIPNYAAAEG